MSSAEEARPVGEDHGSTKRSFTKKTMMIFSTLESIFPQLLVNSQLDFLLNLGNLRVTSAISNILCR